MSPRRILDPIDLVADRGGVVRVAVLTEAGIGRRALERALRSGRLLRVRRGWVATNDADPVLVAAAREGVVITCISQASRLGLWVHEADSRQHVGADPKSAGRKTRRAHVHWFTPIVPRPPDLLEDPIENVLAAVASCEPFERALATWESALNKGLVTLEGLAGYSWKPTARRILAAATPFADAGLETYLRPRLAWLRLPIRIQSWIAGHRVDVLIGDRLVLQIDGAHHVGAQRSEDIRHDAELRLMGYHVIRVSYAQMMHAWPVVQDLVMRAVAQGLHRAA
ncbi:MULTISPECIES: type IV toxin-antitoxin system AbiEi family antitoxin domain-containing protein [unclassified Microbacterium]|uniref:type IV toxin-antitoxin system AbiEi family antitoxin domain-containing protein n=1 Tax=unclassified Microbacterium TaxID=2609290 RepID=UPI003019C3C0